MGSHFTYLVDPTISLAEAPAEAQRMITWLQARGIVGAATRVGDLNRADGFTHPSLSECDGTGYPLGTHYARACRPDVYVPPPIPNWVEVVVRRKVFDAGGNGLEIYCPACNAEQTCLGDAWSDAFSTWHRGDDNAQLACGACGHRQRITEWRYEPQWSFGNLGFNFQNWELSDTFVDEFTAAYGRPLTIVYAKI